MATTSDGVKQAEHRRFPILQGIVPTEKKQMRLDIVAGCTLAALGIPEVMGYTIDRRHAGGHRPLHDPDPDRRLRPPRLVAAPCRRRRLGHGGDHGRRHRWHGGDRVVRQYVALAGMSGASSPVGSCSSWRGILRLGFLADFLSRSVLIGFLTGVGIQVAMGQVAGMLGVESGHERKTLRTFLGTIANFGDAA